MISQRTRGIRMLLALIQGALITVIFWCSFLMLTEAVPGSNIFLARYVGYWIAVLAGFALEVATRGTDRLEAPIYESSAVQHLPVALRQTAFALGAFLLLVVTTKDQAVSRGFLLAFAVQIYAALVWSNAAIARRLPEMVFRGQRATETLLVGPARRIAALENWMERKRQLGVRVVGLLSTDDTAPACATLPNLGTLGELERVLNDYGIAQVILLELPPADLARRLIDVCEQRGIRVIIVNDFAEQIHRPIVSRVDEGVNLITLFEEPLENPFNRILKRAFDLIIAIPVVVLILPVAAVFVALLQQIQSRGPLWHWQQRAGLLNQAFTILKFRTMHLHAGALEEQATSGDGRVFPAGRWLRRFSLDELPQFINVLRGDMSVVGPRPHLVQHNRQFAEVLANYHVRAFIKPGITGLAQVRGFRGEARTTQDIAARLQSDLVYMENWSLTLDVTIVARTIWQMIRPPRTAV